MEERLEHEMETGMILRFVGIRISKKDVFPKPDYNPFGSTLGPP